MRHKTKKVKLGRQPDHVSALIKNLTTSVILYEKVKTTRAKAKAIVPYIEKIITIARKVENGKMGKREGIRELSLRVLDANASRKLLEELGKRYATRSSGFTRITALGFRSGDAAPVVQIELIK